MTRHIRYWQPLTWDECVQVIKGKIEVAEEVLAAVHAGDKDGLFLWYVHWEEEDTFTFEEKLSFVENQLDRLYGLVKLVPKLAQLDDFSHLIVKIGLSNALELGITESKDLPLTVFAIEDSFLLLKKSGGNGDNHEEWSGSMDELIPILQSYIKNLRQSNQA